MKKVQSEPPKPFRAEILFLLIFGTALLLRLLHNSYMMKNPLYDVPLGGHLPYLILAEKIASGDILPINAPFSLNSPLFPYILGIEYRIFGVGQFLFVRLIGILLDCATCVIIAALGKRHFGLIGGLFSGLLAALYGPMIFYAAELTAVPYTLFFVTMSVLLLDRNGKNAGHLLAGLLLGLAIGTRPNLIILALLMLSTPVLFRRKRAFTKSMLMGLGILLMILPITMANYIISGKWVLLTTSGGHNFYLGHRTHSKAGYTLPQSLDGDIFTNMKRLAEEAEGRRFEDHDVSSYYVKKALTHIRNNPLWELKITFKKLMAALNHHEATNYVNYYFQKDISPVLKYSIGFGILFPLALLGWVFHPKKWILFFPIVASLLSIILFFHIARMRMPMIPFLAVFAGGGVRMLFSTIKTSRYSTLALCAVILAGASIFSNWTLGRADTSNEWNKVGVVLRVKKRYEESERAFKRALEENPSNPNSYLNLAVLYDATG
ncbi:MAG: glycosyltransferase family 39 protein, partial [Deltaproteobacteria bacterium]|nr:glycosyltransferase family 39 protein [Deltaproteobacteria bacterium]